MCHMGRLKMFLDQGLFGCRLKVRAIMLLDVEADLYSHMIFSLFCSLVVRSDLLYSTRCCYLRYKVKTNHPSHRFVGVGVVLREGIGS